MARARLILAAVLALALLALLALALHRHVTTLAFRALQDRGENTLRLAESSLRGQLLRFERLPGLLAEERLIRSLLTAPRDPVLVEAANDHLRTTAARLGASDIYVMYRDGETLAASNFDQPYSFVGGNFAFRPYFHDAFAGGAGRFFALGTTSNKRGYYFGAPVRIGGQIFGVVVIKIDLDEIEQAWASTDLRLIVTDPEGVVFLSNRADWLFRSLGPRSDGQVARTQATRRYANATIREIPARVGDERGFRLLQAGISGAQTEYLVLGAAMPDAGWTVQVLSPTRAARLQALAIVAGAALALLAAGFAALTVWQRRRQLAERMAVAQATKAELERRVRDRTAELRAEVAERTLAETRLRDTQTELVQAGKLAALGQMSAALSHEFNQPLAAARTYAENAGLLLERGRNEEAQANIARIVGMIDRMGSISRHLRNFARKPGQQLRAVPLSEVLAAVQELLGWRIDKTGAVLAVDLSPADLAVTAGPVRLQQVLVNLLGNALDAIEGGPDRRLDLTARAAAGQVVITLRDRGPGVPQALRARIFDPFFSTKGVGKGLGLGLSISYNIVRDFGGTLEVDTHPEGGAIFTLRLRPADADTRDLEAAE